MGSPYVGLQERMCGLIYNQEQWVGGLDRGAAENLVIITDMWIQ